MDTTTVHVDKVEVNTETGQVTLTRFDLSEFLSDFSVADIVDSMEFTQVADYVIERMRDE